MAQQVSYRPIKGQSRSWPSKFTAAVSGSHKGESPQLKLTGIQYATTSMLGTTTNGEHRKLIGVKTRLCLGTEYGLYCWDAASVSESELQPTEKIVWCTNQPTKSSCICTELLAVYAAVPHYIFTTVLCGYRVGVMERRYGETFYTQLSSRASSFYVPPEYPPGRQGAVSGVTLESGLYVFLACCIVVVFT